MSATPPSEPRSVEEAAAWLRKAFRSEAAEDLRVGYRIELTGEGGGSLGVRVEQGRLELEPGYRGAADVVCRLDATDFYGILAGRENPDLLFMAERLSIEGPLSLALQLRKLFHAPS